MKNQHITLTGALSGREIHIPDVNQPPMPALAEPGIILNGMAASPAQTIDAAKAYPDVLSFKRKFGLLIPATNTSMEYELWKIIFNNQDTLQGIGIHTSNVVTPAPKLANAEDLRQYRQQFLTGLKTAVDAAALAQPEYLIMGMSLEHILHGMDEIHGSMQEIAQYTNLSWTTWHDAAPAALNKLGAKRIGLITPFDVTGNKNASKMFEDLGYTVVASVGFSCAHAMHIAHIPDSAKEKAIIELLATPDNKLDAIVQCGTNMSMINIIDKLEAKIGIPILGINLTSFWHALRETGFTAKLTGGGALLTL